MTEKDKKVEVKKDSVETDSGFKQRVRIKIKSFDHKIIDQSTKTILETVKRAGAKIYGPIPLPTEKRKYTVNSSTFVHKKSKDQYEMRIHKRIIDIIDPSASAIESLSNLSLPAGVDVEIKM
jgi:small subunit ribosomal protein S10